MLIQEKEDLMNIPNKLTVLRILLVPFFVAFLLISQIPHNLLFALIIFIIASLTDFADGQIARRRNMITDFGKFADPLADKILITSAFACFVELGYMSSVILIIVLIREFTVTSIRLVAAGKGKVVSANFFGKLKTVSQMIAVISVILLNYILYLMEDVFFWQADMFTTCSVVFATLNHVLLWLSALFTVLSGIKYVKDNISFIVTTK